MNKETYGYYIASIVVPDKFDIYNVHFLTNYDNKYSLTEKFSFY